MSSSRKKLITMSIAAALATSLFVGAGTFAYLQANTGTITNKFGKGADDAPVIEISETDVVLDNDGNGEKTYVIENGEKADKDPTVTVNNSMTVFTFVEISDKTTLDGTKVVNYDIADGWTEITGVDCVNEEVTGIYYRVVEANADNKEFAVLKDDEVSYADNLTTGEINNDDVTLAFQAFCIEKQPFVAEGKTELESAIDAYKAIPRAIVYEPTVSFLYSYDDETDTFIIEKYIGGAKDTVNIPKTIDGKNVSEIANNAFDGAEIKMVRIPDTVKNIKVAAFQNTPSLKEVRLSKSLTELTSEVFLNSGLTSVTVPDGVVSVSDSCFANNICLTTVNLPASLEEIGDHVFAGCTSLEEIVLPDGMETLGLSAFEGCNSLTSITIPASVTTFEGGDIFANCNPELKIKGVSGSAAEAYANAHGIVFEPIS